MEKTAYTPAPTLKPTWTERTGRGGVDAPPRASDLKLKDANQAQSFFVTFPQRLKQTFEYARDHPGQFALSVFTSMATYIILRGAITAALGFTPCLAAAVATAMLTSAVISVGRQLVDEIYAPPPDPSDLECVDKATFRSVMSKALTHSLWSGAIAGLTGVFFGNLVNNFKLPVHYMDGSSVEYDSTVNGPVVPSYVDAQGHLPPSPMAYDGNSPYVWPVDPESTNTIYDNCGKRDLHNTGNLKDHTGIDLSTPIGTPVRAAAGGIVTQAEWHSGYGNTITVKHIDESGVAYAQTRYAHLSQYHVRVGDHVDQNTLIARSGNTGNSTGPHLHFEIRGADNKVFNPLQFLPELKELRPNGQPYVVVGESLRQRIFDVFVPGRSH